MRITLFISFLIVILTGCAGQNKNQVNTAGSNKPQTVNMGASETLPECDFRVFAHPSTEDEIALLKCQQYIYWQIEIRTWQESEYHPIAGGTGTFTVVAIKKYLQPNQDYDLRAVKLVNGKKMEIHKITISDGGTSIAKPRLGTRLD